jgi:hypothetical protein
MDDSSGRVHLVAILNRPAGSSVGLQYQSEFGQVLNAYLLVDLPTRAAASVGSDQLRRELQVLGDEVPCLMLQGLDAGQQRGLIHLQMRDVV